MSKNAFISHASKDCEVAQKICAMLEAREIECWIAPRDIIPGRDYGEEIIRGIEETSVTILILSENANESTFVKKEIERAISKAKPVLPVRIREVAPSPGLELFVSSAHWIDAWKSPIDGKIDQLANSIKPLIGQQPIRNAESPSSTTSRSINTKTLVFAAAALVAVAGIAFFWVKSDKSSENTAKVAQPTLPSAPAVNSANNQSAPSGIQPQVTNSEPAQVVTAPSSSNSSSLIQPPLPSDPKLAYVGVWSGDLQCKDQDGKDLILQFTFMGSAKDSTMYFHYQPATGSTTVVKAGCYEVIGHFNPENNNSIGINVKNWIQKTPPDLVEPRFSGKVAGTYIRLGAPAQNCGPLLLERKLPAFEIPASCRASN